MSAIRAGRFDFENDFFLVLTADIRRHPRVSTVEGRRVTLRYSPHRDAVKDEHRRDLVERIRLGKQPDEIVVFDWERRPDKASCAFHASWREVCEAMIQALDMDAEAAIEMRREAAIVRLDRRNLETL